MGYSQRDERYRYTEWPLFEYNTNKPDWNHLAGVELYDHKFDPEENNNLALQKEYDKLIKRLSKELHAGWRDALPNV